jgi:RNA polymerase sigma-70 factor (ECF subfamily)
MDALLSSIYAAYTLAKDQPDLSLSSTSDLAQEALYLAHLLSRIEAANPEVLALYALLLYNEARKPAARLEGQYVPLDEQNTSLWNRDLHRRAEDLLQRSAEIENFLNSEAPVRFRMEAAIQSAHMHRLLSSPDQYKAILDLYAALINRHPSLGAWTAYIAVLAAAGRLDQAEQYFEQLRYPQQETYQAYWALAAELKRRRGDESEAADAYIKAIRLCADPSIRSYLERRAGFH